MTLISHCHLNLTITEIELKNGNLARSNRRQHSSIKVLILKIVLVYYYFIEGYFFSKNKIFIEALGMIRQFPEQKITTTIFSIILYA